MNILKARPRRITVMPSPITARKKKIMQNFTKKENISNRVFDL